MTQILPLTSNCLPEIKMVAADIDGTLTEGHKFTPQLLYAIERLNAKDIQLLLVTGRSAGWVSAVVNYLPVVGAIAENGGVYFDGRGEDYDLFLPIENITDHRDRLANVFWELQSLYPQIEESLDNQFRITDWTFDLKGLNSAQLGEIRSRCQAWGWDFTYSSIQCHIKSIGQDKSTGILNTIEQYFPNLKRTQILTVGDSPNDETMFDRSLFPHSVGVANIQPYLDRLNHIPQYITTHSEVNGFCELVDFLLANP
jgi:HAD superfamily hydrolase (TIGR01484 family)